MNRITIMGDLYNKLLRQIMYRNDKIAAICGKEGGAYEQLADISRHIELLTSDLRESLIQCYDELQAVGCHLPELPMPDAPDISVDICDKSVCIVMDGMLPFPLKGGVHYLHKKLDAALLRYAKENALPAPLFTERCAVVFIHRYAKTGRRLRHLRDYDNTERRCITNVIARHFMRDDSPACYIGMDVIAPGESNHTEVRIMTIPDFSVFVASDEIG